jgi:hypothetical protein
MNLESIVSLLSGSLITLIIKGLIDFANKERAFNRELNRITYSRKLEKAENAVAFYSSYLTTLIEMKKSLEVMVTALRENPEIDFGIVQSILDQNSNSLNLLMQNSHHQSNAIHLYFDLENEKDWNEKDISNMIERIGETKSFDSKIQVWLNLYYDQLEKNEIEIANAYWGKIEEILPLYTDSIQKMIDSFERNKNAIRNIIKEIKNEIKLK